MFSRDAARVEKFRRAEQGSDRAASSLGVNSSLFEENPFAAAATPRVTWVPHYGWAIVDLRDERWQR
jgi:hypothetical protein